MGGAADDFPSWECRLVLLLPEYASVQATLTHTDVRTQPKGALGLCIYIGGVYKRAIKYQNT